MTARRVLPAILAAAACLALAGCGGGAAAKTAAATTTQSTSSSAATSATASTAPAPTFGIADVTACQTYLTGQADAYTYLTELEQQGTVPAGESLKGKLDLLTTGSQASMFVDQVQDRPLADALRAVQTHGAAVAEELSSQEPIEATALRMALDSAAAACERGGFVVSWHH